jgi:hypothetical protein
MVTLVGVMMTVAMLLVLVAELVMRAMGGSRRSRKSKGRDEHSGGHKGFQHGHFLFFPEVLLGVATIARCG